MPDSTNNSGEKDTGKKINPLPEAKQALYIFKYVKPCRYKFATGLLLIVLSSIATMSFPFLLKQLIDSAYALKMGVAATSPGKIALLLIGILGLRMVFSFFQLYFFTYVGENALADVRKDIYRHMIRMPMHFLL
jgi:ABC-type multidrug transport system fused ATPase/permease subunit